MATVVYEHGYRLPLIVIDAQNRNRRIQRKRGLSTGIRPEHADRTVRMHLAAVIPDVNFAMARADSRIQQPSSSLRNRRGDLLQRPRFPLRWLLPRIHVENVRTRMSVRSSNNQVRNTCYPPNVLPQLSEFRLVKGSAQIKRDEC